MPENIAQGSSVPAWGVLTVVVSSDSALQLCPVFLPVRGSHGNFPVTLHHFCPDQGREGGRWWWWWNVAYSSEGQGGTYAS